MEDDIRKVRLPCRPGDKISFFNKKDCCEGADVREDELVECEVDVIRYVLDKNGAIIIINESYKINDINSITVLEGQIS